MIVSVASVYPCILYSALLFSAIHKTSAVGRIPGADAWDVPLLELNALTLSMLREELHQTHADYKAIAAASLMLATAELRYNPEGSAWRMHFDSAKRLLVLAGKQDADDTLSRFIERRVALIQFLIALPTPWSSDRRCISSELQQPDDQCIATIGTIDSTLACVQEVSLAFEYIGQFPSLTDDIERCDNSTTSSAIALSLVVFLQRVIDRDQETPPILSNDIRESCAADEVEEYRICNRIAQHMALLCTYRYGLGLGRDTAIVAESVDAIIDLAHSISKRKGSHPYLCLTTSLFIAGCEAGPERVGDVRALLETHYEVTKSQSTRKSIGMLNSLWASREAGDILISSDGMKESRHIAFSQQWRNYIPY